MINTCEGAIAYEHSMNHCLEFFSKAGSLMEKKQSFYGNEDTALSLFKNSWYADRETSMKLLFWLRDCRGGAGNRSGFRSCLKWIGENDPMWIIFNIQLITETGRWDDLRCLFGTRVETVAVTYWGMALKNKDILAAKWADRSDYQLRHFLKMKLPAFRRFLATIRKNEIVEHKMCTKQWNEINYSHVPSVAMARYTKAFTKHDEERFNAYKAELIKPKEERSPDVKINADVLFPHDCVRTSRNGDVNIADAQFEALPNYIGNTDEKIICIVDTSGSMSSNVCGKIQAVDVSQALGLYCSAKMPADSIFYKKFIAFCSESEFKNWDKMTFSQAVRNGRIFDGAVGSTRIDKALKLLLDTARFFRIKNEDMPTILMILSDMQFHEGSATNETEIERSLKEWDKAEYPRPKIVYWNLAGNPGQQATMSTNNVALVSGFSPSILKAVLGGADFSPMAIMMKALEKYTITIPE